MATTESDGDRNGALERVPSTVGGRRAAFLAMGVGPPVVLVHGLGLSAGVWRPHLPALAERGYAVLAPDLPGFGDSEGPRTGQSVPETAKWLVAFADAVGLEAPAWIGHSISCQAILRLAATDPGRAGPLVLAGPTGRPGRHYLSDFLGLLRTAPRERVRVVGGVLRRYLSQGIPAVGTWIAAQRHDSLADARDVTAPALVVIGTRDPVVPEEFGERLAGTLPRGTLLRIEGAAHAVALDPLPPFVDAVASFLDRAYRARSTSVRWKSSGISPKFHGSSGP